MKYSINLKSVRARVILPLVIVLAVAVGGLFLDVASQPAQAADIGLSVTINAGPNLVVDSNITAASTRSPSAFTVIGKFCNTSGATITDGVGYIGAYNSATPSLSTHGTYPVVTHAGLDGTYTLSHIGGSLGTADAARPLGPLDPGECSVQYWHLSYPRCENNGAPPCAGDPVFLAPTDPDDDLKLNFQMWATAGCAGTGCVDANYSAAATHTVTMRNEISAMANKIKPNPDGDWFNTNQPPVYPGEPITTNGILYTLGNVNKGFDNDGDYLPDFNGWMQPVGDASFDPSCFRLVHTTGVLTVTRSGGVPDTIIYFEDSLYFTNLPSDNTNVTGKIFYTFLPLGGPCSTALSPYQESASGSDNEKFNADYGTAIPPLASLSPKVTLDKTSAPSYVPATGGTFTYQMPFSNIGDVPAGLPLYSVPLVIRDTVPEGLNYVGGSAAASLSYTPNTGVTIRFSTDGGDTWVTTDPGDWTWTTGKKLMIEWWLNEPLPVGNTGSYATFRATVPGTYTGPAYIENCAEASFGINASFAESCTTTWVQGSNSIGDFIWFDKDGDGVQDGGDELGLNDISISLYYDTGTIGVLEDTDLFITMTASLNNGTNDGAYSFGGLADGNYIVVVDTADPQLPAGYSNTTRTAVAVTGLGTTLPATYIAADFGFAPALKLDKVLVSTSPVNEGSQVVYDIQLTNTRPPSANGFCTYTVWGTALGVNNGRNSSQRWNITSEPNALGTQGPDGSFAYAPYASGDGYFSATIFPFPGGTPYGDIIGVEALYLIYLQGTVTDDTAVFQMYWNNAVVAGATDTFTVAELNAYGPSSNSLAYVTQNWYAYPPGGSWEFSDFASASLELMIIADRISGSDGATLYLDAVGFRITTDQECGGADDTITYLPLTDTYNSSLLSFVSADPAHSSPASPAGSITWDNLGPLYGGQTKTVRVTFLALDPGAPPPSTDNTASVTGAKFGSGRSVNDASDIAPVTLVRTAVIGDWVWNDADGDGVQDEGEKGIPGVEVRLCTTSACTSYQTTFTDADGKYSFTATDGTYYVNVPTAPGTWTKDYDGTANGQGTAAVTVSGTNNLDVDFGYRMTTNTIFGKVWEDNNANDIQESGENGFSGLKVYLCNDEPPCSGSGDTDVDADENGNYIFTGLGAGTYYIYVDPNDLPQGPGISWAQTYDPDENLNNWTVITIPASGVWAPYDFAYQRSPATSTIGNTVFTDWDGDGTQDAIDSGISGVRVYLYEDANGNGLVDPATDALLAYQDTNASGVYEFTGVPAGNYITLLDPATLPTTLDLVQTKDPDQNGTCTVCDNKSIVTGVNGTSSYPDEDYGYKPVGGGEIGDYVWIDLDGDGIIAPGEAPLVGVTVNLYYDANGNGFFDTGEPMIATTTSAADGSYSFANLPTSAAGVHYLVDIDTSSAPIPENPDGYTYYLSTQNDLQHVILTDADSTDDSADFGFAPPSKIGDTIYRDNDGDGTQDANEVGIPNVTVQLWTWIWSDFDSDGYRDASEEVSYANTGRTDVTDANGKYDFANLDAGNYLVRVAPAELLAGGDLAGYSLTGDPDARTVPCSSSDPALPTTDDDWHLICSSEAFLTLQYNQVDQSIDFGYKPPRSIGDRVWLDANGDGLQDPTEAGIAGLIVTLYDCGPDDVCGNGDDGPTQTATTDADGYYSFNVPNANDYRVAVATPSGMAPTSERDATLDGWVQLDMSTLSNVMDADFGFRYNGAYTIGGTVWYDADRDQMIDGGESTVYPEQVVYLWDADDNLVATTKTGVDGKYSFPNLPAGTYTVSFSSLSPGVNGLTSTTAMFRSINLSADSLNNNFGFVSDLDLGDLPVKYNLTRLGVDGPRHRVTAPNSGPRLGLLVDTEANGQESITAEGDDKDMVSADEDGVIPTRGHVWTTDNGGKVDITVNGCDGYCYVSAWIDWDDDGSLYTPGDRVLLDYPISSSAKATVTGVSIDVPNGYTITPDDTFFARFRVYGSSTNGTAQPNGYAPDGEVEDYLFRNNPTAVEMVALSATSQPAFTGTFIWLSAAALLGAGSLLAFKAWRKRA